MSSSSLVAHAAARLAAAWRTLPPTMTDATAWVGIAAFVAVALPLGLRSGFLHMRVVKSPAKWVEVLIVVFLTRGLLEELVFRVVLLPHPAVDGPTPPGAFAARTALSLVGFVGFHLLLPGERARRTYWDPRFLAMAGGLGSLCSLVYYLSGGSLLAIWLVHGLPVATWLLCFGGADKVQ